MKKAEKFQQMYNEALSAFESSNGSKSKMDLLLEARLVYNNGYGDLIKSKFKTRSAYTSPDGMVVPDYLGELITARVPDFKFKTNKEYATKAKTSLNGLVRDIIATGNIDKKILPIVISAIRDGVSVCEVVFKEIPDDGFKLEADADGNMATVEYTNKPIPTIDINHYDVLQDEVLIDPLAKSGDVVDTARYVIVKHGSYGKESFEALAKSNNWDYDMGILFPTDSETTYSRDISDNEGFVKPDSISIHKVFYQNGTIDYIANEHFVLAEGIMNNKMVKRMPLIVYTPFSNGDSPYGRSLWSMISHVSDIRSGAINLSSDQAAKNINASIVTDSVALSSELDAFDLFDNKIIHIESAERDVKQRLYQIQMNDMSVGLKLLIDVVSQDLQKITKVSSLSMGSPDFSPRTNGVVESMNSGAQSNISLLLKNTEDTLFTPLGQDIIKIIYNYFPKFEYVEDRELFNIKDVTVQKGTSIIGAQATQSELLKFGLDMALQMPTDWDVLSILKDFFKEAGLPEIEMYLATPEKMMMKNLLAMQIPMDQAQGIMQATMQLQQRQQNIGGK